MTVSQSRGVQNIANLGHLEAYNVIGNDARVDINGELIFVENDLCFTFGVICVLLNLVTQRDRVGSDET